MGASCSKSHGRAVKPMPDQEQETDDIDQLKVDDSAADCIPAGYRAKRRQAVSVTFQSNYFLVYSINP